MRYIKEKGKRYIALLMVCVMMIGLFPVAGYAEPSAIGTPVENLAAGSYIDFGGRTWRLADPSTRYLVLINNLPTFTKWSLSSTNTNATDVFSYLNTEFNNIITVEAHRDMIENTDWDIRCVSYSNKDSVNPPLTTMVTDETSISPLFINGKLGILSVGDRNRYNGFIDNQGQYVEWTRSPVWGSTTDVYIFAYIVSTTSVSNSCKVRPTLYLKSGSTVAGGSGTVDTPYTLEPYDATQDNADIAAAKLAIEASTYTVTQAEAGDSVAAAIKAQALVNALALEGTTAVVVPGTFTSAVSGTSGTLAGTNGSFTFTVTINKGGGTEQTSASKTMTITAAPYTGISDVDAVAAAKVAIETALSNLAVSNTTTDNDVLATAQGATLHNVVVAWDGTNSFIKTNATSSAAGSITGTLNLTLGSASDTVEVIKNITMLLPLFSFNPTTKTIYGYSGPGGAVEIPAEINGIAVEVIGGAFQNKGLTSVVIPNSVITIEENAFRNNEINSLIIGNSVETIGLGAFAQNQLNTITIPNSVISMDFGALLFNQLTSITMERTDTTIDGALLVSTNDYFKDVYTSIDGGFGTYIGTQEGTWTKVGLSDQEKIALAKTSIDTALISLSVSNATTAAEILTLATGATLHGVTVAWDDTSGFNKTNATSSAAGSITGTLKFTLNSASDSVAVSKTITQLPATGGGNTSDNSTPSTPSTPQSPANTIVNVNGVPVSAGTETRTTEGGKTTILVQVNNEVIQSKIDEAISKNSNNASNSIQVQVSDTNTVSSRVELTGDIVKKLEENAFNVSVKNNDIEYIIPAKEFTISKVAETLNIREADLKAITVEVRITKPDEQAVETYTEVAKANGAELIFPPVTFELVAKTTQSDGTTGEMKISKFSNYVERVMEIPAGMDKSKITTGIVFNLDGTYSHVPTSVYQKDGKWYASINSLTNSTYSVIWNHITVKSVENHWAKDAVNDMASRLVIKNPETFMPDQNITRGEFAEYMTKAIGIFRSGAVNTQKFTDVKVKHELANAIEIASEYGIISGYPDGSFKPDAQISREEAMTMYSKAMTIVGLEEVDDGKINNYTDKDLVARWAYDAVKKTLSAGVFNGKTSQTINPKDTFTCAEAVTAIRNLLVAKELINE